jgi:hypothetical protein
MSHRPVALAASVSIVAAMRRWFGCLLFFAASSAVTIGRAAPGEFHASTLETKQEIVAVVAGQLAAFRAGDVNKAYTFASTALRAQTPLRTFLAIVQANYPEIWGNTAAEYGIVRDDGARATVLVHVKAAQSEAAFDYVLLKERGAWKIASVVRHIARKKDDV